MSRPDNSPLEGNHRITRVSGTALVPLLGLVFLTGLAMDSYWHVHYVIGFVLIPMVALKLASTGYRAARYYTGSPIYRAAGPPQLFMRLLAPLLVIAVAVALATGVALFVAHSRTGVLSTLHTDSSVITAGVVGIHLLAYARDAATGTFAELRRRAPRGRLARLSLAAAALAVGAMLAALTYPSGTWPTRQDRPARGGQTGVVRQEVGPILPPPADGR